jgi:NTP pyrophosphatase (non-canonical NTP hydrolase)
VDLREYQQRAALTDRVPLLSLTGDVPEGPAILVPLLGLAGEVGSLLTEFKKHLRDGNAHRMFREQVKEDLGDLLWYVANVASKFGLDLDDIAAANLAKTRDRWPSEGVSHRKLFDEAYPANEQLPRRFAIRVEEAVQEERVEVTYSLEGTQVGNALTDNAYEDDGYRFHDVFHFAYAALLGWSPVLRDHLRCKRRSDPRTKEVEDGGRAKVIEEAVVAVVHDYATRHNCLADVETLDYSLLKKVKGLVAGREVEVCSLHEWERAILVGYRAWRQVRDNRGGLVVGDLLARTLEYHSDEHAHVLVTSAQAHDLAGGTASDPATIRGKEE